MTKSTSIEKLASAVFDNKRRGQPRPGCDCEQCFGYCMVDKEIAVRHHFGDQRPEEKEGAI